MVASLRLQQELNNSTPQSSHPIPRPRSWGPGALGPWGPGALGPWGPGALGPWGPASEARLLRFTSFNGGVTLPVKFKKSSPTEPRAGKVGMTKKSWCAGEPRNNIKCNVLWHCIVLQQDMAFFMIFLMAFHGSSHPQVP